jgi:hypothetical protein
VFHFNKAWLSIALVGVKIEVLVGDKKGGARGIGGI